MRLFCCGITSNETEKIKDLIESTKNYFDGYVWCVDSALHSDSTFLLLQENKKDGKIVRNNWSNSHDLQENIWLHCGVFKENDWIYIADSSEKPTENWLSIMKRDIEGFEKAGVVAVFCSGRPFLVKWTEYLFFMFTPHWTLDGISGKIINIPDENKDFYIINKRKENPDKHYQEHDTKYYLYGRSNQMEMFYGKYGRQVVNHHEDIRKLFRQELKNLGYECNLEGFEKYLKKGEFSDFSKSVIELEFCLSEFYQRKVLNQDFMSFIVPRRKKFSFKDYLNGGDGFPENYKSTIMKYNEQFNMKEN